MEITEVLNNVLEKIKTTLDAESVIGAPIVNNEYVRVIPITRMSLGFAGLGGEIEGKKFKPDKDLPLGGIGAGADIRPVGFLVVNGERVRFIGVEEGGIGLDKCLENVRDYLLKS